MSDLSYTNKDGLNPAAGFTNVFNYHKDAASSGQGYEHGGYPEVTGETSPYSSLNYKTGDVLDHWGNGNTFDIIPSGGGGGGDFTVTLPLVNFYNCGLDYFSGLENFSFAVGDVYNVKVNGTTYENITAVSVNDTGEYDYANILGNYTLAINNNSDIPRQATVESLNDDVLSGVPFFFELYSSNDNKAVTVNVISEEVLDSLVIELTSVSTGETYTFDFSEIDNQACAYCLYLKTKNITAFAPELGKTQEVVINGDSHLMTWKYIEGMDNVLCLTDTDNNDDLWESVFVGYNEEELEQGMAGCYLSDNIPIDGTEPPFPHIIKFPGISAE